MSIGHLRIPGHEFAGEVAAVGEAVTRVSVGDRVVHEPIQYCGACYACRNGQGNVCNEVKVTGCNCSGGWQEYFVADEGQWHKIPDWVTWEEAALVEPYTIAGQACTRAELQAGDTVLIHGGGPIGLMCGDTARHLGAKVIVSEVMEGRLQLAKEMGIDYVINAKEKSVKDAVMEITNGEGVNIVMDCAGLRGAVSESMELLTPAGRFVPVAMAEPMHIENPIMIMVKQLKIVGSRLQMKQFAPVIARYALYKENIDRMITDVFPFEESDKAFAYAAARDPKTGKIVIRFD